MQIFFENYEDYTAFADKIVKKSILEVSQNMYNVKMYNVWSATL